MRTRKRDRIKVVRPMTYIYPHVSLLLATSFLDLFDCIQDFIYRERVQTLQVSLQKNMGILTCRISLASDYSNMIII
jgi:hypothetical protein